MTNTVIIVGAPRSGTNMLRDVLTSTPGIATWNCDEIPLIWRHGNLDVPHDELGPERATPRVRAFLRREFDKIAQRYDAAVVVEKTCATSLRVPFVAEVFPDASYVFIRRDGIDAAASAMRRWNAAFDVRYTLRKLRYVPPADVPRHFVGFAARRLTQVVRREGAGSETDRMVSTWWGPRPHDYRRLQRVHPLDELALIQWQRCVEQAATALAALPEGQVLKVGYEDFVADPRGGTQRVLDFLGQGHLLAATDFSRVSAASVGKGRRQLGAEATGRLTAMGVQTLRRFGYE